MKKVIVMLAVLLAFGSAMHVSAQQPQQQRVKFYYYPSSNVYYNDVTGEYWYYDEPTIKWVEVKTLPATITIQKTPVYTVYYNGEDVWKDNTMHQKKYKVKKGYIKDKGDKH